MSSACESLFLIYTTCQLTIFAALTSIIQSCAAFSGGINEQLLLLCLGLFTVCVIVMSWYGLNTFAFAMLMPIAFVLVWTTYFEEPALSTYKWTEYTLILLAVCAVLKCCIKDPETLTTFICVSVCLLGLGCCLMLLFDDNNKDTTLRNRIPYLLSLLAIVCVYANTNLLFLENECSPHNVPWYCWKNITTRIRQSGV